MMNSPSKNYGTETDQKMRWGGLLENPYISTIQRNCLDWGRVQSIQKALKPYDYRSVVDIGCGLADNAGVSKGFYLGVDNSARRIKFAQRRYPQHHFMVGGSIGLPVDDHSFDLSMLIDTSHHLPDEVFKNTLQELKRVSRKYVVISDPVLFDGQGKLSKLFYDLDRGRCFRDVKQMMKIIQDVGGLTTQEVVHFKTVPGLYIHVVFILTV